MEDLNVTQYEPQPDFLCISEQNQHLSIGFLKDTIPFKGFVCMMPQKIELLTEKEIQVYVEGNFGKHAKYTDLEYANAGADLIESVPVICQMSDVIVKLEPFTKQELYQMKEGQIILSSIDIYNLNLHYFDLLSQKNITAFALDLIEDEDADSILNDIFFREEDAIGITVSLTNFIYPLIVDLATSGTLTSAVKTCPELMQSLYFYEGAITNQKIASKINT
ncbi:MAG: hypothetical protein LBU51_01925 [Bacteroidales bacterium]|jgi:alanine dehydrogenase|nr:hypothetical protein [Bacteroidales bacterium]